MKTIPIDWLTWLIDWLIDYQVQYLIFNNFSKKD